MVVMGNAGTSAGGQRPEPVRLQNPEVHQATGMLIVTHEMQFARDVSHKVMMFDGGQIVEQGAPDDLLANPQHKRTQRFLESIL